MKAPFLLLTVLILLATPAHAGVRVENGNVFYDDHQLTLYGTDAEAVVSPDGRWIAFIRQTPTENIETGSAIAMANEIWIVRPNGEDMRQLVKGREGVPGTLLAGLSTPVFAPDSKTLYFLSDDTAVSRAVHAVTLAEGAERFVTAGNSLQVIPAGDYAGYLIVQKHKYYMAGGSYDWYWLVKPNGEDVGAFGPSLDTVNSFVKPAGVR